MQDDRQIEILRQTHLLDEEMRLALQVQAGDEEIEPDLTDADETRMGPGRLHPLAQHRKVAVRRLVDQQRMDAERKVDIRMRVHQLINAVEMIDADGRHHERADPGLAGGRKHLRHGQPQTPTRPGGSGYR